MIRDTGEIIRDLTDLLAGRPLQDYLASDDFARFCQDYDLSDEWAKYLQLCRDNPALYGNFSIERHAFILFLSHVHHHMPERFLFLFTRLLLDFSHGLTCDLPLEGVRSSLLHLGYPPEKIDAALSALGIPREPEPAGSMGCRN